MLPTQTLDNEGQIQVVAKVSVMDPALLALFNAGQADNAAIKDTVVALEAEAEGHRDAAAAARNDTEQMRDEVQSLTATSTGAAAAASDSAALASGKASDAADSAAAALASEQAAAASEATANAQAGSATASAEASAISAAESRTSRLAAEVAEQAAKDSLAATNTARTATETARDATLASETRTHTAKNTAEAQATIATTQAGAATNQATNADLARQAAEAARTRAVAAETTAVNKAAEATNRADEAAADAEQTDIDRSAVAVMKEETSLLVMNARAAKEGAEIAQSSSESSAQTAGIAAQNAATSAGSASSSALAAAASAVLASDHVDAAALSETNAQTAATTAVQAKDRAVQAETTVVNNIDAATQAAQSTAADLIAVSGHRTHVDTVVDQFDIDAAAAIQAAQTARQGAEDAAASIPANAITDAPVDGKQYVRQDAAWEEVVIPENTGGSVDPSLVPTRHDFVFTGMYQDEINDKAAYLVSGVLDPIDFPGDIGTTNYFGSVPTVENGSFLFKRREFNSPDVGTQGLGMYFDGNTGAAEPTSELVPVFTTLNGVPTEELLTVYAAHYSSIPLLNDLPGMIAPLETVKQTVYYLREESSGSRVVHSARTRLLYRVTALDPWQLMVDWEGEYFDPIPTSGSTGGIEEAPLDGKKYSRESGAWSEIVIPTPEVTEAPADNKQYVRKNESWEEVALPASGIPEAPVDGKTYNRKDAEWVEVEVPVSNAGVDSGNFKLPMWHFYESTKPNEPGVIHPSYLVNGTLFTNDYKYSRDGYFWGTTSGFPSKEPIVMFYHEGIDAYSTHYDTQSGFAIIKNPMNPMSSKTWTSATWSASNRTVHPILDGTGRLFHTIGGGVAEVPLHDNGHSILVGSLNPVFAFSDNSFYSYGAGYCPDTGKIMVSAGKGNRFDAYDYNFVNNQKPGKLYITEDSFATVSEVPLPAGLEQVSSLKYSPYYKCFFFAGVVSTGLDEVTFNIYKVDISGPSPVFTKLVDGWQIFTTDTQPFDFDIVENVIGFNRLISYDGVNFQSLGDEMYTWLRPKEYYSASSFYFKQGDSAKLSGSWSRQFFNRGSFTVV